jgi:hypothetical protein
VHDQKLIVSLMSSKCSLRNVFLVHTYLVVAITKIKFSKEHGTTQFIQEVINDKNGEFFFNGEFVEGAEVNTYAPRYLFLKDHDHRRRVGARTRTDNTCGEKFLNNFLNFIFLGKWMMIGMNIGRRVVEDKVLHVKIPHFDNVSFSLSQVSQASHFFHKCRKCHIFVLCVSHCERHHGNT